MRFQFDKTPNYIGNTVTYSSARGGFNVNNIKTVNNFNCIIILQNIFQKGDIFRTLLEDVPIQPIIQSNINGPH